MISDEQASKTAVKLINIVAFTAVFAHFMSCFFAACGLHAWEANPLGDFGWVITTWNSIKLGRTDIGLEALRALD